MGFQKQIVAGLKQKYPLFYNGNYINLDFHSVPHFGGQSQMEQVWCGAKNKTMKGADTAIAQDAQSNLILYTKADILRREEPQEVLNFVKYWKLDIPEDKWVKVNLPIPKRKYQKVSGLWANRPTIRLQKWIQANSR